MTLTRLLMALSALALVACTSTRIVADGGQASAQYLQRQNSGLTAGDRATLTLADGRHMALKIASVDRESVQGTVVGGDQFVAVPVGDVVRIERKQVSGARTTGLVLASLLVVSAITVYEVRDGIEDIFRTAGQ